MTFTKLFGKQEGKKDLLRGFGNLIQGIVKEKKEKGELEFKSDEEAQPGHKKNSSSVGNFFKGLLSELDGKKNEGKEGEPGKSSKEIELKEFLISKKEDDENKK